MSDTDDFNSDSDVSDDARRGEIPSEGDRDVSDDAGDSDASDDACDSDASDDSGDSDTSSVKENVNGNRKYKSGEKEDEIGDDKATKITKNKRKKNSTAELPTKKIGPQRQKKEIHTFLKKAKKYEIRKLTRRITVLRNLKGSDQQKAKNNRKVATLLHEIQAMKEFMIDQITERTVDIFKGKSEQMYLDMWTAAQDHKEFEKMIQVLSNSSDDKKYENIAFLRMISSKDIVRHLKLIYTGTNVIKPKSRKALRKQLRKYNQRNKKLRKRETAPSDNTKNDTDQPMQIDGEITNDNTIISSKSPKPGKNKVVTFSPNAAKKKKVKKFSDPFFLPDSNPLDNDDDYDDDSSEEEFSAPIQEVHETLPKKKNRMGQRMRKKLMLEQQTIESKGSTRHIQKHRTHDKTQKHRTHDKTHKPSKDINKSIVDKELHPSWQAKQRQKAQQGITAFSGTKIKFDD